jgi:hypothetical protein
MRVRKYNPGSSSHGHVWEEAGQILDIPAEDAADLMRVAPGEFEFVPDEPETPEDPPQDPEPEDPEDAGGPEDPESPATPEPVTEPEPQPEAEPEPMPELAPKPGDDEPAETKKPPARRPRAPRKVTED